MSRSFRILLGLAVGWGLLHTAHGLWTTSLVQRELAALDAEGLLERHGPASAESEELVAAREQLAVLTSWMADLHYGPEGLEPTYNPHVHEPAELSRLVGARQPFYEGLDALPELLWEARGAPFNQTVSDRPRLMTLRACTNALNLKAWASARDHGDGLAAGRTCARALALARIQDDGGSGGLMLRWSALSAVLGNIEQMSAAGFAAERDLLLPLAEELHAFEGSERLAVMLGSDLVFLHAWERELAPSVRGWLTRPGIMSERLEFLVGYHRGRRQQPLMAFLAGAEFSDCRFPGDPRGGEVLAFHLAPTLRIVGHEDGMWLHWQDLALQHDRFREQVSALLAKI